MPLDESGSETAQPLPQSRTRNPQRRPRVGVVGLKDEHVEAIRSLCGTLYDDLIPNLREVDLVVSGWKLQEPIPAHVLLWGSDASHEIRTPTRDAWREAADLILGSELAGDPSVYPEFLKSAWSYVEMLLNERRKGSDVTDEIAQTLHPHIQTIGRGRQYGQEILTVELDVFSEGVEQLYRDIRDAPLSVEGIVSLTVGESPIVWTSDASLVAFYSPTGHSADQASFENVANWDWIGLTIPEEAHLAIWLRCFLEYLHEKDPEVVPERPPRLGTPDDWFTPKQVVIAGRRDQIRSKIRDLLKETEQLEDELRHEGEKADREIRRVLWADGSELEDAATEVLDDLGFDVAVVDQELAPGEPKREDLQVFDPSAPAEVVLVEVKGYPYDAKTGDLKQIREQRERCIERKGEAPAASWWIVNDHRSTPDPTNRGPSLPGAIELLTTHGVVAVPTRDLYRLWRDVGLGKLSPEAARALLMRAEPGVFLYPGSKAAR